MATTPHELAIGIRRRFTKRGEHPYDSIAWDTRDARIQNFRDGGDAFFQPGVEFPSTWSVNSTNIVAQKYFRGTLGTAEREWSLRQVIDRVADTITEWGRSDGYFTDDSEAEAFRDELKYILVHQRAAFNSPVWFNIGVKGVPQQASACQPYHAPVATPEGLIPIGALVTANAVGAKVFDANGLTQIVAVKHNGTKPVLRVHTKAGIPLDLTADHLVWRTTGAGSGRFVEAGTLRPGDQLEWHRAESWGHGEIIAEDVTQAALAGWLQGDGLVGQYDTGTNRSLTIEAMTVTAAEHAWVSELIDVVFPCVHRHERTFATVDTSLDGRRIRLYGEVLRPFVERFGLLERGGTARVAPELFTAPSPVVAAYLRSLFQADGYVTHGNCVVGLDLIDEELVRGVQQLLMRFGIFSRVRRKEDRRENRKGTWSLTIQVAGDRRRFADEIGFVDPRKCEALEAGFALPGRRATEVKRLEIERIEHLGDLDVYDIQTESGEYLSNHLRVHNCFILAVDDTMDDILNWYREEGIIFKGGSGAGVNLSKIRSSKELLKGGGTASGPVSFMRGADASAGTIKSGGKTRRAAKMVILNADHPDIEEFVWCKAIEERKARALGAAGFDMDLDGKDSHSIQYQNANNSVRVTDEFMQAVEADADWDLRAVKTGEPIKTVRARDLWRQIAESSWECADPGLQFDTTINRWHTAHATGRINGSNPCFTGDTYVHTDKGLVRFAALADRVRAGESFGVYTHDATNAEAPAERVEVTSPEAIMLTGFNEIVRLRFDNGSELRCTPNHRVWTTNRGYVRADELTPHDEIKTLTLPTPAAHADWSISPVVRLEAMRGTSTRDGRSGEYWLPDKWSEDLAHYLGWLVGDGCISGNVVTTVYGSEEEQREVLPRHRALAAAMNAMSDGEGPKPSVQSNGTLQLRQSRKVIARFFAALGVSRTKAADKTVPEAINGAPSEVVAAFLRGLFDADGCVYDGDTTRYVGLASASADLLRGVQRLLSTFGIFSRVYATRRSGAAAFSYTRRDGNTVEYAARELYDLRISSHDIASFARAIGFSATTKAGKLERLLATRTFGAARRTVRLVERAEDGVEFTFNLTETRNHSYIANGAIVANCSEYMHLDNSACNLASINLLKFLGDDGSFDVDGYKHTIEVVFTAQEILVGNADYPTPAIGETSRRFRQLGLGYANLGALLMAQGMPYDSDDGRAWAAALTSLMTGHAYATSARTAARMGPFAGYADNAQYMNGVLELHRSHAATIDEDIVPVELLSAAQHAWDEAVELGARHGVRNSQSTVLAPTGTIGLMMDCDTTGIEPDLALTKAKKLVGGGTMFIVNQTVPRALRRLGYDDVQVQAIVSYIDENKSIIGAPGLDPNHLPVFACSMGDNPIHYMGHVTMMAAVQPFISGAISKCVVGETLLTTADGLVRIGSLHRSEAPDTFRDEIIEVASLGGPTKTSAFYFGGRRRVRSVVLRSGHRITGTDNHRVLVARDGDLTWVGLDEISEGDFVAVQYGDDLWSGTPASLDEFVPTAAHGSQKSVRLPSTMSDELAFLLGAYVAEGHTTRSNWTITITNSVESVLERVQGAWRDLFGVVARIDRPADRCPSVVVSSKTIVEFLTYLGCGDRASAKRIPDAVLRSPRSAVLSFLQGLALDAYVTTTAMAKWAICVDSPALLDDLQAVLTNLGIVHGRISKWNPKYEKHYDEVYATGHDAQRLVSLVPFVEPDKAERAQRLAERVIDVRHDTADVIPGIEPAALYALLRKGRGERGGTGSDVANEFRFLADRRTKRATRRALERVALVPGVVLPQWLRTVLDDNLHFSDVVDVADAGEAPVFDVAVPSTQAFVGNGIVNHNTVNLPEDVTIEDVEDVHLAAWKLGLKAVALYRDNCKVGQPLSTQKPLSTQQIAGEGDAGAGSAVSDVGVEIQRIVEHVIVQEPVRQKLPRTRTAKTFSFRVADCHGYVTVGEYEDGRPGELFLQVAKQGSTLAGIMDAFAISVSHGLQYGVPLEAFVKMFTNMRFEPAGMTDDPDIRFATSLVDYIFRRLAVEYLPYDQREALGVLTVGERMQPTLPGVEEAATRSSSALDLGPDDLPPSAAVQPQEAPVQKSAQKPAPKPIARQHEVVLCHACGDIMQRAGSCHVCTSCGATSGCS